MILTDLPFGWFPIPLVRSALLSISIGKIISVVLKPGVGEFTETAPGRSLDSRICPELGSPFSGLIILRAVSPILFTPITLIVNTHLA